MALRGHVFDKQLFGNECFALFIDTFLGGNNGVVNGCTMTWSDTNKISLAPRIFLHPRKIFTRNNRNRF